MVVSNRDRVGQMFEAMAPALENFISQTIGAQLGDGADWSRLVALKDQQNGVTGRTYAPQDPQIQLRMLTENIPAQVKPGWYPFDGLLSQVHRSYASELREARNTWAHNGSFTNDDAYRVLDTAERLLNAINEPEAADRVTKIRLNLRRVASAKDDQRALRQVIVSPDPAGLQPWREVLPPHNDVSTGNFQAAEFAADLHKVAHGEDVGKDYADPVEFFTRTYLTSGLQELITGAVRRLSGDDNAPPVINLQTNFGGGKTHSMLALWHLAAGVERARFPQELQELLGSSGYDSIPSHAGRVAIVGNHTSPSGSIKPDGTVVNTVWGELAWQLGGAQGFAIMAKADFDRTPPGQALHTLLSEYSPAVILIDEWVAYARSLMDRNDLAGGTFDDQFTFAQSLTEAVKGTSGVLLAISIPASEAGISEVGAGHAEEVGGTAGLEALKRLQNVVRRVAVQWRPASSNEAYHIVRQRLFTTPDAAGLAAINATARAFGEMYRKHADDFPREARVSDYEDRIRQTYPIHPELFDRLYEDWSSLERFQRTRGVLRLMNTVIHALWTGNDVSPLIMPGSIPLATASVNSELTQYLQDSWKAVVDADVDGPNSEPVKIDEAKMLYGQRMVTRRLARTVFFGAAPTIGSAHKGLQTQRVFLGTAMPGDVPGNFHSALSQLGDRATYFYSGSGKYWYDLQANISRRAKDQAERKHPEDVWQEIARRLGAEAKRPGDFAAVHVCPGDSGDIPDLDEARLVVLHPKLTHRRNQADSPAMVFAKQATESRGNAGRVNRNMLVFLAPDQDRMAELDSAVRDYLGWADVLEHKDDLDLTKNQLAQAESKRTQADELVSARLGGTYQWVLNPDGQPVTVQATKVDGQAASSLAERVSRRLVNDGALSPHQAAAAIRHTLNSELRTAWEHGHISVGELWRLYAQYAYLPRLRDRSVLSAGLAKAPLLWQTEGVALAEAYDSETGRYRGLVLPSDTAPLHVTDATLVVKPELAMAQRAKEAAIPAQAASNDASSTVIPEPRPDSPAEVQAHDRLTRFYASKALNADRYVMDFKKIADEVLTHLAADPDTEFRVTVEIEATSSKGFEDRQIRILGENAHTLKFEQSDFEVH